jgi:hypothetical protein
VVLAKYVIENWRGEAEYRLVAIRDRNTHRTALHVFRKSRGGCLDVTPYIAALLP